MKDMNFLPQWYADDRWEHSVLRTQFISLAVIFSLLAVWNFVTAHSVSAARAELEQVVSKKEAVADTVAEFNDLKSQLELGTQKIKLIDTLRSEIDPTAVLAELSHLVGTEVVISSVNIRAEKFVELSRRRRGLTLHGDARYQLEISGRSLTSQAAARFLCDIEDSAYFCEVTPVYSKSSLNVQGTGSLSGEQVTEFKVNCYLANYDMETSI